jgi:hypothetical protein
VRICPFRCKALQHVLIAAVPVLDENNETINTKLALADIEGMFADDFNDQVR